MKFIPDEATIIRMAMATNIKAAETGEQLLLFKKIM
jgi:hypothetical protein